jgi:mono/diheme cytochrome c family protein
MRLALLAPLAAAAACSGAAPHPVTPVTLDAAAGRGGDAPAAPPAGDRADGAPPGADSGVDATTAGDAAAADASGGPGDPNDPGGPGDPANPYPDALLCPEPPRITTGLSAGFASQCAGCHGPAGDGRAPFPGLHAVPDVDSFVRTVREGRKQMPPFDEVAAPRDRLIADFAALTAPAPAASGADPDCGPGYRSLPPLGEAERAARISRGMAAYRRPGPKGACAGCHSAAAIDLAFIGFSDADILRRAIPQVGVEDARAVVDLVHALRVRHRIDRPLHPRRFRLLQPGDEPLPEMRQPAVYPQLASPGEHDAARDAAFARALVDDVRLRLVGDPIASLAEARAAERQLLELDLRRLKVGVPFPRWTEDGFHGAGSNVPNEWVAMLARRPADTDPGAFPALADAYIQDPSDANLWRLYDGIERTTAGDDATPLAARWSLRKYQALQVASHMLLRRTRALPDPLAGVASTDPAERRALAIARNPFWRVGDAVRQNPFNCNQPDPCTTLPPALDATLNAGDQARERQSYEEKMSWFWLGFTLDPALVVTEDSLATVSGDYFLALSQPWYQVHNAFVVAAIATAKANARAYQDVKGVALPGHGLWASPRPFMAFKHSERELHHPPRNDLRYAIHERLWANSFRMYLYLMNDELGRTGKVFDRARTVDAVGFIHQWFGRTLEVGQDHATLDALVTELRGRLARAAEIGVASGS